MGFWADITQRLGFFAGPLLSFLMMWCESLSVITMTFSLDYALKHKSPFSRRITSLFVMIAHAECEAFRLAILTTGVIKTPKSLVWIPSMISSLIFNILSRSGWVRYGFFRITSSKVLLPTEVTKVQQIARYSWGYPRFFTVIAICITRFFNGCKGESIFFSMHAITVVLAALVGEVIEDFVVWRLAQRGCTPNYWQHATAAEYYNRLRLDSPFRHALAPDQHGSLMTRINIKDMVGHQFLGIGIAAVTTMYLNILAFVLLLGSDFAFGLSEDISFSLTNGAILATRDVP